MNLTFASPSPSAPAGACAVTAHQLPPLGDATKRWMHTQLEYHTRYVERVLHTLQGQLFPDFEVHTEFNHLTRDYVWGLGYHREAGIHRHFHFVVEICPLWSADGELTSLRSSLRLPKRKDLLALAAESGLFFDGFGAIMDTGSEHPAGEPALIAELDRLLPLRFVAAFLPVLRETAATPVSALGSRREGELISLVSAL